MTTNSQTGPRAPRLNPFVFPSDTTFRFVLLIVLVLGASLFTYNALYLAIAGDELIGVEECMAMIPSSEDLRPESALEAPTDLLAAAEASAKCGISAKLHTAAFMLGGVATLLGVAGAIYWLYPSWKIRREGFVPLGDEDAPEVVTYLTELCKEAGLARTPVFLWDPLSLTSSGLAFGRLGRYYVAFSGGLVTQFYTDRPAFRAIVLHELAHLRNADVNKTYFAVAVWWAFVVVALVPFAVTQLYSGLFDNHEDLYYVFSAGWRILVLAVVVYLTRNAVLRAREVYADVRASAWEGAGGALGRVLGALPRPKTGGRWRNVLRVHPEPDERRRALEETYRLFGMGFWDAFGTGIAAAIALPSVDFLLSQLAQGTGIVAAIAELNTTDSFLVTLVSGVAYLLTIGALGAGLIFAPLIVGVVGLGAWRATFAALTRGEVPGGAGRLGLALGLGFGLGRVLSFEGVAGSFPGGTPVGSVFFLSFSVLWTGLIVAILFFFLRWIVAGASLWVGVAATHRSLRLAYVSGLIAAGGLLALWIGLLFMVRDVVESSVASAPDFAEALVSPFLWLSSTVLFVLSDPLTLPALIVLWAFPLASCLWHKRVPSPSASSGWAFLDQSAQQSALSPSQAACRPRLATKSGLVGGLIFCVLLLGLRVWWQLEVSEATRNTDQAKLVFAFAQIALATLMQAGVAGVVAGRVRQLGSIHGLYAAFVAGFVMSVGILGLNLLFGGGIDLGFIWTVFSLVINGGALLALPSVLVATMSVGWVRRFASPK